MVVAYQYATIYSANVDKKQEIWSKSELQNFSHLLQLMASSGSAQFENFEELKL